MESGEQREIPIQSDFTVTEISTGFHMLMVLTNGKGGVVPEVRDTVYRLVEKKDKAKQKLFVVQTKAGSWAVVAESSEEISALQPEIEAVATYEQQLDPKTLRHRCVAVHREAAKNIPHSQISPIADGVLGAAKHSETTKAVYYVQVPHCIGYKSVPDQEKTLIFDLVSRVYMFTDTDADTPICSGLMIVEKDSTYPITRMLYETPFTKQDV